MLPVALCLPTPVMIPKVITLPNLALSPTTPVGLGLWPKPAGEPVRLEGRGQGLWPRTC